MARAQGAPSPASSFIWSGRCSRTRRRRRSRCSMRSIRSIGRASARRWPRRSPGRAASPRCSSRSIPAPSRRRPGSCRKRPTPSCRLPRALRPRHRRADVHSAGGRAAGAALCADRQDRPPQRPLAAVHGHERGFSARDRVRRHACAGGDGHLRRTGAPGVRPTNVRWRSACSGPVPPGGAGGRGHRAPRIPPSATGSAAPHA